MLSVPVLGTEHMLSSHILPFWETSDMMRELRRNDVMAPSLDAEQLSATLVSPGLAG